MPRINDSELLEFPFLVGSSGVGLKGDIASTKETVKATTKNVSKINTKPHPDGPNMLIASYDHNCRP